MTKSRMHFTPDWNEAQPPAGSYRALFKWGDPNAYKHPNHRLVRFMMDTFALDRSDLTRRRDEGLEPVPETAPVRLAKRHLVALGNLVGAENLRTDTFSRVRMSYGKGMIDALRLRQRLVENLPDAVLAPRSTGDVQAVVAYCDRHRIPLYVFGGGSTVTRGMEAVKGGVSLDMSAHMKRVVSFNEMDQTITVEAGMSGPRLEALLNNAPEMLGAQGRYTCGHFPQSFEYSSVGGWVVTRGAGQNSTYYGKIEDIVIAQQMVTPRGTLQTMPQPRCATGPDFDQILIGSEGCFGVLTEATLRVFHWMPQNTRRFSYMFRSWGQALAAVREVMQAEAGFPSVFRLSDPEETDIAMKLYGIEGSPADALLKAFGYQPMQKCLLLGSADGERGYARRLDAAIRRICRRHGAFDLSLFPVTARWERDRFRDPYLREDIGDFGIVTDTLECGVTWSQLEAVHAAVRQVVKARPKTVCMTHCSHMYPQGTNLYFIFISPMAGIDEYLDLQYAMLDAIQKSGASMSHHHGMGKQTGPWLEGSIGAPAMAVLRALKDHFDPRNILNPGGTLGLDMTREQREKRWGRSD